MNVTADHHQKTSRVVAHSVEESPIETDVLNVMMVVFFRGLSFHPGFLLVVVVIDSRSLLLEMEELNLHFIFL